jgi:putative PIN family toxin of toxin-antitoxin system
MRLVIDNNVFVSLLIRPGESLTALSDYIDKFGTVLYSIETITELTDVLSRKKFAKYTSSDEIVTLLTWVTTNGEFVAVEAPVTGSRDIKDNKFLSVAVAGRADYLISGDQDLLVLGAVSGTPIVTPKDFLSTLTP